MPNWKFWDKSKEHEEAKPATEAPRRFTARPRTDLLDASKVADPEKSEKLARLRKRRDAVMFDVEQAEMANEPDNQWLQRAQLLDDALATVQADRARVQAEREAPGKPIDPIPISGITFIEGPPPAVAFTVGNASFRYEEDLDWAERGFQLARSELQLRLGDAITLAGADEALQTHLIDSLFAFASDIRDRALAGEPLPENVTLADLARPDENAGGWFLWGGSSPAAQRKLHALQELTREEQRLLDERKHELDELAKIADRLPIARRRLSDVDAEIAALGM
jgi:hypothetical protein